MLVVSRRDADTLQQPRLIARDFADTSVSPTFPTLTWTTQTPGSSSISTEPTSNATFSPPDSGPSLFFIVFIVFAGCIVLGILLCVCHRWWNRRRRRQLPPSAQFLHSVAPRDPTDENAQRRSVANAEALLVPAHASAGASATMVTEMRRVRTREARRSEGRKVERGERGERRKSARSES